MTSRQRERKQVAIVESLRLGVSIVAACVATGIGRATFYRWLSDEDFEEAVSAARMAVVQEAMAELWKQAKGYYVDEERVVETAIGPKRVRRTRWVSGKVSAVNAILRMMEKDGKELAESWGTTEGTEGTERREGRDYEYDYDYEEGGDLEPGMDRKGTEGERIEPQMDTDGHRFDGARPVTGEERGDVSRFEGEMGLTTEGTEGHGEEAGSLKAVLHTPEGGDVSRFEGEESVAGGEAGVRELKLAPMPAEAGTPFGMGGDGEGLDAGGVSRFEGEKGIAVRDDCGHHLGRKGIAVRDDCGHHGEGKARGRRLSRRERRALEREAYRAEKKARKAAARKA